MSRIIVKNIPKNVTEYDLQEHFSTKGDVTDVKIVKTESGKSRLFAFIGFKSESQGKDSIKYFNNSYFKTNKISVEEAKVQGDKALNKPWSKHTKWSKNEAMVKKTNTNKVEDGKTKPTVEDTKTKLKRLQEIEKFTSTKFKFDYVEGIENNNNLALNIDGQEEKESNNNEKEDIENNNVIDDHDINEKAKKEKNKNKFFNSDLEEYDPKRLYLRNLSFQVNEEDIEQAFSKFGALTEASIPRDRNKNSFGYGFVAFETTESTLMALEKMDKKVFQGRILHITPAKSKDIKPSLPLTQLQTNNKKTSYKKDKLLKLKGEFDKEVSWNFLFLNQNAVIEAVARQTNTDKQDILSKDNAKLAVEVAAMETVMISKTKEWLESHGIDLAPFNNKRLLTARSKTVILIKNIDTSMNEEELKKLFSRYGELIQFLVSPHNIMGIAEFIDAKNAENCYRNLSFYEVNELPLYLEYAPIGFKVSKTKNENSNTNEEGASKELQFDEGNVIFINNLNFDTKEEGLSKLFEDYNPSNVKIVRNKTKNNSNLSAGYGFVEFKTSEEADIVLRKLNGTILDSHSLKLSKAKSKVNNQEKEKQELEFLAHKRKRDTEYAEVDKEDFETARDDKLLVKNLAFEASKDEIRELFKQFGDVKNVRLPVKTSGDHRGYAFVEFLTHEEAKNAFSKLSNTHFYGRKLVIEWAKKDKSVEEIRNETQKKLNTMKITTHRTQEKSTLNK